MKNLFFRRTEFACRCGCGFDTVDAELLIVLTKLRIEFGPIHINCGARCRLHNASSKVGGAKNSQHLLGKAADVIAFRASAEKVYDWLDKKYPDQYGLGSYRTFTHFDVRKFKARW